jgi:glycosyltransferase involved in cell wall biosynthesis
MIDRAIAPVELATLTHADMVLPVYESIVPDLKEMGVVKFQVAYNSLNPDFLREKEDYALHDPVKVISTGRQLRKKNPDRIIRAIAHMPGLHLTLVGDGPLHEYLQDVAAMCEAQDRITFHRAIPNDELCDMLPDFDIFAAHTEYREISKSVLEPILTGMPVVINRRKGEPVPELQGDFVITVDNTVEAFRDAFTKLTENDDFREQLGRKAYAHAQELWAPADMEARFAEIYRSVMKK